MALSHEHLISDREMGSINTEVTSGPWETFADCFPNAYEIGLKLGIQTLDAIEAYNAHMPPEKRFQDPRAAWGMVIDTLTSAGITPGRQGTPEWDEYMASARELLPIFQGKTKEELQDTLAQHRERQNR